METSEITTAISLVRQAAGCTGDTSGNVDSALYLIEKCGAYEETIRNLDWAEKNNRIAGYKIKEAIEAVKKIAHNS